jgi:hypothetical protein
VTGSFEIQQRDGNLRRGHSVAAYFPTFQKNAFPSSARIEGCYWTAWHDDKRAINLPKVSKHQPNDTAPHRATTPHSPPHLSQVGFSTSRATVSYTTAPRVSYFRVPYLLYIFFLAYFDQKRLQVTAVTRGNFIRLVPCGNAPSALNGWWPDVARHQDAGGINCKADLTLPPVTTHVRKQSGPLIFKISTQFPFKSLMS